MRYKPEEGRYSIEDIALFVGISTKTLYRWRLEGKLISTFDVEENAELAWQLQILKQRPMGLGPTRFSPEDVVRIGLIGQLGYVGWDRVKLLDALGQPYCSSFEAPDYLVLVPQRDLSVTDSVVYRIVAGTAETETELDAIRGERPCLMVIDLPKYRDWANEFLARLEAGREIKARGKKLA
jgi:hypothetical protein